MRLHTPRITGSLAVSSSILTIDTLGSVSGSATSTGSFGSVYGLNLNDAGMSISSVSLVSSSIATRFDSRETDMTLATASIAALTASISRLNTEISTDDTDMTLATASIALNESNMTLATASIAAITASLGQPVNTDSNVTFNDINSTGTITAVEVHTTFVSSSITVASGSNNFGDDTSDHHSFTGSVSISSSLSVTESISTNKVQALTGEGLELFDDGGNGIFIEDGGQVGINTTSPDKLLHVNAADGEQDNTSVAKFVNLESTSGRSKGVDIQAGTSNDDYMLSMDDQSGSTKFRFTGAGNLGIGTASPGDYSTSADNLVVKDAAHAGITIASPSNKSGNLFFADGDDNSDNQVYEGFIQYDHGNNVTDAMMFGTAGAERMRIASDGKVGINTANPVRALSVSYGAAKTSTDTAYAMAIQSNESANQAALQFYVVGGASAAVRRFQIQSGEVGVANSGIIEFQPDGGDVRFPNGILFGSDTTAANELDDYEEGTWTPAILYQNASGVSLDYATDGFQVGRYTKIGNVVHARLSIQVDISGSPVNDNISISGFPFTSINVTNFEGAGVADQLMITGKANYALSMGGNSTSAGMILSSISGNQGDEIGTRDNYRFNGGVTYLAA